VIGARAFSYQSQSKLPFMAGRALSLIWHLPNWRQSPPPPHQLEKEPILTISIMLAGGHMCIFRVLQYVVKLQREAESVEKVFTQHLLLVPILTAGEPECRAKKWFLD
jgi:hypothetical protein